MRCHKKVKLQKYNILDFYNFKKIKNSLKVAVYMYIYYLVIYRLI